MFSSGIWWRQGTALGHQETPSSYKRSLVPTEGTSEQGELSRDPQMHSAPFLARGGWEGNVPHALGGLWLKAALPTVGAIPMAGDHSESVASVT